MKIMKSFLVLSMIIVLCTGISVAQDKVVVTIASGTVGLEKELIDTAAAMYSESHPNVEVKTIETPESATDRLGLYLQCFQAKSSEVDIYQIDVIWPGDLAEHLIDLNEYGGVEAAKEHFPAIVENNTVDGKLVAIPWFTDAGLLYYRKDLLEKYGYGEAPKTWDQLEEMASRGGVDVIEREMPDQWMEELAVAGDPEECAEKLSGYFDAGADSVVLMPLPPGRATQVLELAAKEVLPRIQQYT